MPVKYWMISNRNVEKKGLGTDRATLSYWCSSGGPLDDFKNWKKVSYETFRTALIGAATEFPLIEDPEKNEKQKHVTLFVHGYNNDWEDACKRYESICGKLYDGPDSLGICVLFSWPSDGWTTDYLPDRADARESALDFANVLSDLYDWLLTKQADAAKNPKLACRAKTSIIAHSMGNYLLQKAMQVAWTRKNQPLLVSLVNQLVMVAADVDNDLFGGGESTDKSDGDAIANLTYRVTALYTGRDAVLGASAGLKHFGKRRLGRSGLDRSLPPPDNVWDIDCTNLIPKEADNIHSACFESLKTLAVMRLLLRGVDRKLIETGL